MASLPGALEGTRPVPYPWQQVEGATRPKLRPWLGWSPVLSLRKVISQHPNGPAGDGQPGLGGLVQPWLVQAASTRSLSSSALSCWEGSQLTSLKFPLRQISRRNLPCKFLLSVCRWATSSLSSVSRSESLTLCSASKPRTLAATSVCTSEAGSHALWSGTYASSVKGREGGRTVSMTLGTPMGYRRTLTSICLRLRAHGSLSHPHLATSPDPSVWVPYDFSAMGDPGPPELPWPGLSPFWA